MNTSRPFAVRALAVILAFALWLPGPAAAQSMVEKGNVTGGNVSGHVFGAALTAPLNVKLGDMNLRLKLNAGTLQNLSVTPIVKTTPEQALIMPQSVAAHPVMEILNRLQSAGVQLPDTANTPADAARLVAAAQTLPEGPARDKLLALAQAITAPKGGSESISKVYDNGAKPEAGVNAVAAKAGIWEKLANFPVLRKSRYIQNQADKRKPLSQPADPKNFELSVEQMRWTPSSEQLPASTKEVAIGEHRIVGQDAALKALRFGMKMPGGNYNLFVSGPNGTGRASAVKAILAEVAPAMPTPNDLVAVTNFADEDQPQILELAPGKGAVFQKAVATFFKMAEATLPQVLGSEGQVGEVKASLEAKLQATVKARQKAFDAEVAKIKVGRFGMMVKMVKGEDGVQISIVPTLDGKAVKPEEIDAQIKAGKMTQDEWDSALAAMQEKAQPVLENLQAMMQKNQEDLQKVQEQINGLVNKVIAVVMQELAKPLLVAADGSPEAQVFVVNMIKRVMANIGMFLPQDKAADPNSIHPLNAANPEDLARVSVLADNSAGKGAPVVWEEHPTYENLFGSADANVRSIIVPGAGLIKGKGMGGPTLTGGSFLKANGGFLVLDAMAVLRQPGAWQTLMHAVRTGQAEITEGGLKGLATMEGGKYYVPSKVKVVLLGSPMIKMMLREHDEDFANGFNASAEFESELPINAESISGYIEFLKSSVVKSAGAIMDLARDAISAVLEQSARLVGSNQKLTAQFGALYGLLREASFFAKESGRQEIAAADIATALSARTDREEGYIKHYMEYYFKNIMHVETSGAVVGQINALSVLGHSFGVPARETVTVIPAAGRGGEEDLDVNIGWTGPTYKAGAEESNSFILETFAKDSKGRSRPFPAIMRVKHEQLSGGIDGDSSTSTRIYAMLSALSGVPIKQTFAVTGSADQKGNLQAIGGVNFKIEGFYALCKARGLTGDQGVIIPTTNVEDLQLSAEVVQAVKEGKFHIYAVNHVSEGIQILTGVPYEPKAGERRMGLTIKEKIETRLEEMRASAKN